MALNKDAVYTAAKGYIYTAPVDTAAPTVAQISGFDPDVTGNEVQTVTVTGSPTGGTFTLTYDTQTTSALPYNATPAAVQTALEALTNIGAGNVTVSGGPLPGTAITVTFKGELANTDVAQMTATSSLTGGSTPAVSVSTTGLAWAWKNIGHTARDELPVFGYEGGDVETRGTWQAEVIKTVVTEPASDYVTFNVHQFDKTNMEFYYGQASTSADPNVYSVASSGVAAVKRALLIVIVDGDYKLGFYAPSTEIRREDSIELAVDEFAFMPLRATLTKSDASSVLFSWLNVGSSAA